MANHRVSSKVLLCTHAKPITAYFFTMTLIKALLKTEETSVWPNGFQVRFGDILINSDLTVRVIQFNHLPTMNNWHAHHAESAFQELAWCKTM